MSCECRRVCESSAYTIIFPLGGLVHDTKTLSEVWGGWFDIFNTCTLTTACNIIFFFFFLSFIYVKGTPVWIVAFLLFKYFCWLKKSIILLTLLFVRLPGVIVLQHLRRVPGGLIQILIYIHLICLNNLRVRITFWTSQIVNNIIFIVLKRDLRNAIHLHKQGHWF